MVRSIFILLFAVSANFLFSILDLNLEFSKTDKFFLVHIEAGKKVEKK